MGKLIHRKCACGCGRITNLGKKYVWGHNGHGKGVKLSKEAKRNMSLAAIGNTNRKGKKGHKHSEESKLKMSLSSIKYNPKYKYCDEWKDRKYRKDLLKDHCEGEECEGTYKKLDNHHIDLNKKHCHPSNIMTLCVPCSSILHWKLDLIANKRGANHEDYLTINRKDHIFYVLKGSRKTLTLKRKEERRNETEQENKEGKD